MPSQQKWFPGSLVSFWECVVECGCVKFVFGEASRRIITIKHDKLGWSWNEAFGYRKQRLVPPWTQVNFHCVSCATCGCMVNRCWKDANAFPVCSRRIPKNPVVFNWRWLCRKENRREEFSGQASGEGTQQERTLGTATSNTYTLDFMLSFTGL